MKIVRREQWIIERCRGKTVLHLGCTDSPMTEQKLEQGGLLHLKLLAVSKQVIGVDIDGPALSLLALKAKVPDLYLHDIEHIDTLPVRATLDIVLAGEVVEHLNNVGAFFDSCKKLLSNNQRSVLIVTVPNAFSAKRFLMACLFRKEHVHPDHSAYFSPSTLSCIARRHSLRIIGLHGYIWENPKLGNRVANTVAKIFIAVFGSLFADGLIAEISACTDDSP